MSGVFKSRVLILFLVLCCAACSRERQGTSGEECVCAVRGDRDSVLPQAGSGLAASRGALLGSRFNSFEELKSVVQIEYANDPAGTDSRIHNNSRVSVRHCVDGIGVVSVLESGISQGDIAEAKAGSFWDRLDVLFQSPYAVSRRKDLERVFLLARLRPYLFGEGDVAFFNLAQASVRNIKTADRAFGNSRDTTEKGYINTFNHITAQAFITTCFSEKLADFVADAHERYHHPELIRGAFTEEQINDLEEGPLDNYVDLVNNEWGQELGKQLKEKYRISRKTHWTPDLMAGYLNDLQQYYGWAFQIGFEPFRPDDEPVVKFAAKMNAVMNRVRFDTY